MNTKHRTATTPATAQPADRLVHPTEAKQILGSNCKTNHGLLRLAQLGKLEIVYLGARSIRVRESSLLRLVNGTTSRAA